MGTAKRTLVYFKSDGINRSVGVLRDDSPMISKMSRKRNANRRKYLQIGGKWRQMKEKMVCGNLPQLAEFVRLATPLARFGKVVRTASKQRVGSSSLPGRATSLILLSQVARCSWKLSAGARSCVSSATLLKSGTPSPSEKPN